MKKVILNALMTSVIAAAAIFAVASGIVFIENGFPIPTMIYVPETANVLTGIQIWYWIAFIFGFCYVFFFVFFPKRFWKPPERIIREVDSDSDNGFQEKELALLEKNRLVRRNKIIYFQFSGIFCGLWLILITVIFSQL
ncbi:MAG: hypothetical protein J1G30_07040 [Spirochaetales bacterium]|nr:hypothetical protein [Spirochaetales bacterium]